MLYVKNSLNLLWLVLLGFLSVVSAVWLVASLVLNPMPVVSIILATAILSFLFYMIGG
ncbi:hypothetical protein GCM10007868_06690 [Gluconobacter frateurii]|uniref:Uncharacterized protein n=2 Tax=Gluconobacter frateurii TaxID=38308 RepID=A0ABQ0QFG8_9PROT|nr:hypothetical protein AA0228_3017 [Gluconobacter frateurii NRIC 0228]GLP89594.1 hypothetical protein GCM10007868_06690 [Gluconobacter frateurii]